MDILIREVGPVDAERFVSYINRENFNYTDWQQDLFAGESIDEIAAKARAAGDALRRSMPDKSSVRELGEKIMAFSAASNK